MSTVSRWNTKGFGFAGDIFIHASVLCEHLAPARGSLVPPGTEVHLHVEQGPKGKQAKSALCAACAVPPRWEYKLTGKTATDPVTGKAFAEVESVQTAGRRTDEGRPTFQADWDRNAAYREAHHRADLWGKGTSVGTGAEIKKLAVEFGEPDVSIEGNEVVLRWPHGEKRADVASAITVWGVEPVDGARMAAGIRVDAPPADANPRFAQYRAIWAQVKVARCPGLLWARAARVAASPTNPEGAETDYAWEHLDAETQDEIRAVVAPLLPSPEACAERVWTDGTERREESLRRYHQQRVAMHAGPIRAERQFLSYSAGEYLSEDEMGTREAWVEYTYLAVRVEPREVAREVDYLDASWPQGAAYLAPHHRREVHGPRYGLFEIDAGTVLGRGNDPPHKPPPDETLSPETQRDRWLAARWEHLLTPEEAIHHGLSMAALPGYVTTLLPPAWLARRAARWDALFNGIDVSRYNADLAWVQFDGPAADGDLTDLTWTPSIVERIYHGEFRCFGVATVNDRRCLLTDPPLLTRWTRDRAQAEAWLSTVTERLPELRAAADLDAKVPALLARAEADPYAGGAEVGLHWTAMRGTQLTPEDAPGWIDQMERLFQKIDALRAEEEAEKQAKIREYLDARAVMIASVPEDAEEITCSFGSPTNRLRSEGFWDWPVIITDATGAKVGVIVQVNSKWTASPGVGLVSVKHDSGYHGGYVTMVILAPKGCVATHGEWAPEDAPPAPVATIEPTKRAAQPKVVAKSTGGVTLGDMLRAKGKTL